MKKILPLLLALSLIFSACKKESKCVNACLNGGVCNENTGQCVCANSYTGIDCSTAPSACSLQNFGYVRVNSGHTDDYYIYINNAYVGTQSGGSSAIYTSHSGYVTIQEKQVNYIFTQNTYSQAGTITDCNTVNANF